VQIGARQAQFLGRRGILARVELWCRQNGPYQCRIDQGLGKRGYYRQDEGAVIRGVREASTRVGSARERPIGKRRGRNSLKVSMGRGTSQFPVK